MAQPTVGIAIMDPHGIAVLNHKVLVLPIGFVRKMTNQVTRRRGAKLPAVLAGEVHNEVVESPGGHIGIGQRIGLAPLEGGFHIRDQALLERIVTDEIGAPVVGLPLTENRTKIEHNKITVLKRPILRTVVIGQDGVRARAHHPTMPMPT